LTREWGRSGSPGTVRVTSFENFEEAQKAERRAIMQRLRHGYSAANEQ
jgi:predicted DNA-binding WGR domain protein